MVRYSHQYRFVLQPLSVYLTGGPLLCIHGVYRSSDADELASLPRRSCARCDYNARLLDTLEPSLQWVRATAAALRVVNRRGRALLSVGTLLAACQHSLSAPYR